MNEYPLLFFIPFGLVALIFLVDVVADAVTAIRNRFAPAGMSTSYGPGFTLRRTDSELRERYHRPQLPGRTTEIVKDKFDPYDV